MYLYGEEYIQWIKNNKNSIYTPIVDAFRFVLLKRSPKWPCCSLCIVFHFYAWRQLGKKMSVRNYTDVTWNAQSVGVFCGDGISSIFIESMGSIHQYFP